MLHVTTPEVYGSTDEGWIKEDNNLRQVLHMLSAEPLVIYI